MTTWSSRPSASGTSSDSLAGRRGHPRVGLRRALAGRRAHRPAQPGCLCASTWSCFLQHSAPGLQHAAPVAQQSEALLKWWKEAALHRGGPPTSPTCASNRPCSSPFRSDLVRADGVAPRNSNSIEVGARVLWSLWCAPVRRRHGRRDRAPRFHRRRRSDPSRNSCRLANGLPKARWRAQCPLQASRRGWG